MKSCFPLSYRDLASAFTTIFGPQKSIEIFYSLTLEISHQSTGRG